jgi:type IV secretion system protein VirB11
VSLDKAKDRYRLDRWNSWRRERTGLDQAQLLALYDAGDVEAFLRAAVRAHLNILLAGETGAGKTTLAKSMLSEIDDSERIITIEDTAELLIRQPNHVRLLYSKDDRSGTHIDADALLQASLRMRPTRVLLQELRDDAAWTYIQEVCTGHPGSVTTIHGASAPDAFRRLFTLAKTSPRGAALDDNTLTDHLAAAVDLIVPLHENRGIFALGAVWFVADARRRGETARELLR